MLTAMSPQDFVNKWRRITLKESSASQEHFIDLCQLIGHPTPATVDPIGQAFSFEKEASKQQGGEGRADVWKKGYFAWEYKGKHKDLDAAYNQLLQYREALLNPPLLVVSDMERIIIHTNFTNTAKKVVLLELGDLLKPEGLNQLHAVFFDPEAFQLPQTAEQVTLEAASEFAKLSELLTKYGEDPQQSAHFLIRLLFCLFAEDIGLLPRDLFTQLVRNTKGQPNTFKEQLRQLFETMTTGGWFGISKIRHFNGRLFDDDTVSELDSDGMDILDRVGSLDWSSIEPSIFGILFERSLDPSKRSQIGAHYTSREDILTIVEPVLMEPLRCRFEEARQKALELARDRDKAKDKQIYKKYENELTKLLRLFADEISQVQVLDPACGSGNFLYVALKQLLDLEKEVVTLASSLGLTRFFPSVSPSQLHGIEINAYAHELAQATIWIGYIQWLRENGFGMPSEPILKPLDSILHIDAILDHDEGGHIIEPKWPRADVIIGNPPFLGGNKVRQMLGDEYANNLFILYKGRIPAFADLVCYWFEKARVLIAEGKSKRAGLLATQSIRTGASRKVLDRIKETGGIFWAQSDRDWILDGAAVHVSMVGFDNGTEVNKVLNDKPVGDIHANLASTVKLLLAKPLKENHNLCFYGSQEKGSFKISSSQARNFLSQDNPFGRENQNVVKRSINASQLMGHAKEAWTIDFGIDMPLEEAALHEGPFEYVKKVVYPERQKRRETCQKERWWLHARPSPRYREIVARQKRYIATPAVSKYRVFAWLDSTILASHSLVVFSREDYYFFGVLQSKIHELWARRQGSQLRESESGSCYTPGTTFITFPFPWSPGKEPVNNPVVETIEEAARELVEKREAWLRVESSSGTRKTDRTFTNLYNNRPTWLDLAHRKIDNAVLDAYGWPHTLTDEQILENLLKLNLERSSA